MFEPLSVSAPAKLNLFLHITGRRPDEYHDLQTLFQLLAYGAELHFAARADEHVTRSPALPGVAHDDTLITRAAHMLWPYRTVPCGVHILLTKRLPLGGGHVQRVQEVVRVSVVGVPGQDEGGRAAVDGCVDEIGR